MVLKTRETFRVLKLPLENLSRLALLGCLNLKKKYWKQRNTVRWVKFGDENSQFFHTMATIAHKNFIVTFSNSDGNLIIDHEQKANLLWGSFKERMEVSEYQGIIFNLADLLIPQDLSLLYDDFSMEEIE
jgi:hypothetical protein